MSEPDSGESVVAGEGEVAAENPPADEAAESDVTQRLSPEDAAAADEPTKQYPPDDLEPGERAPVDTLPPGEAPGEKAVDKPPEENPVEANVDMEKITELVASSKVADLLPIIEEAGPNKLAAIKQAEEDGKERQGVLDAVEAREAELAEQGVATSTEVAVTQQFDDAPISERLPLIIAGDWVRFANAKGVPPYLVGRDGIVISALTRRSEGGDTMSSLPYLYQEPDDVFLVEARDTRERFQVTRDAFSAHDPDRTRLTSVATAPATVPVEVPTAAEPEPEPVEA